MKHICKHCQYYVATDPRHGKCDNVDIRVVTVYPHSTCSMYEDRLSILSRLRCLVRRVRSKCRGKLG